MQRLQVTNDKEDLTLQDALRPLLSKNSDKLSILMGSKKLDGSKTLVELGLKHGSLLTLANNQKKSGSSQLTQRKKEEPSARFDPFPDLAKDYKAAMRKRLISRNTGSSYADLADLQSALHTVEPQGKGPLLRVYMCRTSAERFATKGGDCALLLGSFQRERIKPRAKTSLSTPENKTALAAPVEEGMML